MKVKRYEAKTLQEALAQVKQELGSEAVILLSRRIPRWEALKSALRRPAVEVLAAVSPNGQKPPITKRVSGSERPPEGVALSREPIAPRRAPEEPPQYRRLLGLLRDAGVEETLSRRVIRGLFEEASGERPVPDRFLMGRLASALIKWIPTAGPVRLTPGRPRVVAFVGPTGSGKTTTLVKLASRYALEDPSQVVLVTMDTFRLGAVEQLTSFGQLLGVPVEVAHTVWDVADIVDHYSQASLICVDTAGRGPGDAAHIANLRETFRRIPAVEVHLVLGATIRDHEMEAVANAFYDVPFHRVLFTKVDEGITLGSMLNLAWKVNSPISYIATGQRIPEDLEPATPERITDLILRPYW